MARDASTHVATNARLEALYSDLLPVVYGFSRSRVPEHDAEDVTAEVFRAALQRLQRDPEVELKPSWFLTVARNLIVDRWRRQLRWNGRLELLRRDVDVSSFDDRGGSTDRVLDALDHLSDDHRSVLVLRYVDGCSSKDIAVALGKSPRAVDSLIARARSALAEAYEGLDR
jgi:RNA polymerase sigma-70 factor (ECF subfamily)